MSDHPGQETQGSALRELVAKWREEARSNYEGGVGPCLLDCADELEALLRDASTALSPPVSGWQPIETAPAGERVLIGGGACPYVHENTLRDFGSAGMMWRGLGNKQQPSHWMPLPPAPDLLSPRPQQKKAEG
jgi:hypothetical protein